MEEHLKERIDSFLTHNKVLSRVNVRLSKRLLHLDGNLILSLIKWALPYDIGLNSKFWDSIPRLLSILDFLHGLEIFSRFGEESWLLRFLGLLFLVDFDIIIPVNYYTKSYIITAQKCDSLRKKS